MQALLYPDYKPPNSTLLSLAEDDWEQDEVEWSTGDVPAGQNATMTDLVDAVLLMNLESLNDSEY